MSRRRVFSRETPETRCAFCLFVYSGQVLSNPGLRVDGGLKFSFVGKVFSLLIFRGLGACKPSSKVERKKWLKSNI